MCVERYSQSVSETRVGTFAFERNREHCGNPAGRFDHNAFEVAVASRAYEVVLAGVIRVAIPAGRQAVLRRAVTREASCLHFQRHSGLSPLQGSGDVRCNPASPQNRRCEPGAGDAQRQATGARRVQCGGPTPTPTRFNSILADRCRSSEAWSFHTGFGRSGSSPRAARRWRGRLRRSPPERSLRQAGVAEASPLTTRVTRRAAVRLRSAAEVTAMLAEQRELTRSSWVR